MSHNDIPENVRRSASFAIASESGKSIISTDFFRRKPEQSDKASLSSLRWEVFSSYQFSHGSLHPTSENSERAYSPGDHPQLATDLANLGVGGEQSIIDFAERWGPLGYEVLKKTDSGETGNVPLPENGDPLPWIRAHAEGMRLLLDITDYRRRNDIRGLETYLRNLGATGGTPSSGDPSAGMVLTFIYGNRTEKALGQLWGIKSWDDLAAEVIKAILNPNIRMIFPMVDRTLAPGKKGLNLQHECATLIEMAYFHLARLATGELELVRCEVCGQYFVRTHGRQRYCPPPPWQSSGADSRCARRARKQDTHQKQTSSRMLRGAEGTA